jgi:hypothetical protein
MQVTEGANEATFGGGTDPMSTLVNGAMSLFTNGAH